MTLTADDDIFYNYADGETYCPVGFTLYENDIAIATGTITELEAFINNYTTGFEPNEVIDHKYTLSWAWPYHVDADSDAYDTVLGDIAAGIRTDIPTEDYSLTVGFTISITVFRVAE